MTSSNLKYLLKTPSLFFPPPSLNTITLEARALTYGLGRAGDINIQSTVTENCGRDGVFSLTTFTSSCVVDCYHELD